MSLIPSCVTASPMPRAAPDHGEFALREYVKGWEDAGLAHGGGFLRAGDRGTRPLMTLENGIEAMERVTISMSDEFAAELTAFMESAGYGNRSEALRDLARLGLQRERMDASSAGECFATLSYVYNHLTRELSKRLTSAHHDHHHLHVATLHVHLDHENCLEVAVLRGKAKAVRDFANGVIAERGVTHGQVSFIPVTLEAEMHQHGDEANAGKHLHAHPKE